MGLAKDLRLGNMDAKRDWGFAGDYVEAMYLMLQKNKCDDYVIGTGESHSVSEFVELAFKYAKIDNWKKYIVIDPQFKRPAEVPVLKARPEKAIKNLNWKPKVSFDSLVKMMVEADLKRYEK